jgi:hypothetical protein
MKSNGQRTTDSIDIALLFYFSSFKQTSNTENFVNCISFSRSEAWFVRSRDHDCAVNNVFLGIFDTNDKLELEKVVELVWNW